MKKTILFFVFAACFVSESNFAQSLFPHNGMPSQAHQEMERTAWRQRVQNESENIDPFESKVCRIYVAGTRQFIGQFFVENDQAKVQIVTASPEVVIRPFVNISNGTYDRFYNEKKVHAIARYKGYPLFSFKDGDEGFRILFGLNEGGAVTPEIPVLVLEEPDTSDLCYYLAKSGTDEKNLIMRSFWRPFIDALIEMLEANHLVN